MNNNQPLKQILIATRDHWDRPEIRPAVRENFDKMINCRTPALGAEVFASEAEEKLVYHSCKSRSCPSCGQRATLLWQREQWVALPDIPYSGMGFTMPANYGQSSAEPPAPPRLARTRGGSDPAMGEN